MGFGEGRGLRVKDGCERRGAFVDAAMRGG